MSDLKFALQLENFVFEVPGVGVFQARGKLAAGNRLVVRGPSGCGKTTFLRAIAGLHPAQGSLQIFGHEVLNLPPSERGLGFVFQDAALFPFLNVIDNLTFGLRYRPTTKHLSDEIKRARAKALLGQFDLADLAERAVNRLSGGEAQRIALLRALILEPKVLLLDEPLSKLDSDNRRLLAAWIDELAQKAEIATVVVSHQQDELTMGATKVFDWKIPQKGAGTCSIEF